MTHADTRVEHWIDGNLITLDLEDVWLETFAKWDGLVPTDTAAAIATATVDALKKGAQHE